MSKVSDLVRAVRNVPLATLVRTTARGPLEMEAAQLLVGLPEMEIVEITGPIRFPATISDPSTRHAWSLHATDQIALQAVIVGRNVHTAFEIGTFNGGTTRMLAESLPDDGRVVTLDLPASRFDATQHPDSFSGSQVGNAYRGSRCAGKVQQLLQDSLEFDPSSIAGQFDIVLVDGAHDYEHGVADAATALTLVAPGGVILFDDFVPYWHGLIRGITTGMRGQHLARLAGTPMGVHVSRAANSAG